MNHEDSIVRSGQRMSVHFNTICVFSQVNKKKNEMKTDRPSVWWCSHII